MINKEDFFAAARTLLGKLNQDQVNGFNSILASDQKTALFKALKIPMATSTLQRLSPAGVDLIIDFEGLELEAYLDSAGIWTIGIGTIRYPNGSKVKKGDKCTRDQAVSWFKDYIVGVENFIHKVIKVPLTQNQFDALVSLIYNIGETQFTGGTVDDKLNAGKFKEATDTWLQYRRAGGRVVQGLINRRVKEVALFNR